MVDPSEFFGIRLGGDQLVGVVAAVNRGAEGGDGMGDLGVRVDFVHERSIGEIEDVDDLVATAKRDESAVDNSRGAVDEILGFVFPDNGTVFRTKAAGDAVVAVYEHPFGFAVRAGDDGGRGGKFIATLDRPDFFARLEIERVEMLIA